MNDPEVLRLAQMRDYDRQVELGRMAAIEVVEQGASPEPRPNPHQLTPGSTDLERRRWFGWENGYAREMREQGVATLDVRWPDVTQNYAVDAPLQPDAELARRREQDAATLEL